MNRVYGSMNRIHGGPIYESMKFIKRESLASGATAEI
jgi:hypothetical protein